MYTKRIIPCLDVKDGRVVKGTNFVGLRDAGDPVDAVRAKNSAVVDDVEQQVTLARASDGVGLDDARTDASLLGSVVDGYAQPVSRAVAQDFQR